MGYLERIEECNRHDLKGFVPLWVGGVIVGAVREDRVAKIEGVTRAIERRSDDGLALRGDTTNARTLAFESLVAVLLEAGELPPRLGELFPVARRFGDPFLAVIDRSAVAWFGIRAYGVHVNGFVAASDGLAMWIATRARDKPTFPGMLDNIVAGGQPIALTPFENVVKECGEEAGIPRSLASRAVAVGAVSYCVEHPRGLKPDTMFCYDLELPPEFVPTAVDGEVERFELLPIAEVATLVRDTERFKFNCNLVVIDFLVRRGHIGPETPDYLAIVNGLRRPLRAGSWI